MALKFIKKLYSGAAPYYSLGVLLLILTYLLSIATQDSSALNSLFLPLLGVGMLTLILLIAILSRSIYHLYHDYKNKKSGSKLTIRLVSLFALLILASTSVVYGFSIHFLHRGVDSWFDVKVEQALNNSLKLSRTAFGIRMRTLLRQTRMMTGLLNELPDSDLNHNIRELTHLSGAIEMSLWSMDGQLITSSVENPAIILPSRPNNTIFSQLERKEDYIGMDPDKDKLQLRAAVLLPHKQSLQQDRFLQVIFPIDEHLSSLGHTVQKAYREYKELNYLRKPLISVFTLTLSLIVFLTLLASIWFAIWISRRIVEPLQELAAGTQAVASGNYNTQLTPSDHDEIGFLVRSFNQMIQRLTHARHATQHSHSQLEQQTNYLSTVLSSLSSGVITIDKKNILRTVNLAGSKILNLDLAKQLEQPIDTLKIIAPQISSFISLIERQNSNGINWQQQVELQQQKGLQTLMCRGTALPHAGWVIVFDDITTLLQAQRNAAWGEVAKRLAHEIKNPLTPIQLSAERLQHKYLPMLPQEQSETLTKLTNTIIKQVEAMKYMVNDFSDYARNPGLQLQSLDIGLLLQDVLALYKSNPKHHITLNESNEKILIKIDSNRFRQVLHNLLKNAIEASEDAELEVALTLNYQPLIIDNLPWLEITISDHGPGIPNEMINTLFEPYATNKRKGTGLGLAIVKKIIEEHHGYVWAENTHDGACIIIRLPLEETLTKL